MQLKPSIVALVLLAASAALLAARGVIFADRLSAPMPLTELRPPAELTIYYHERRPYYFREADNVRGLVVDRATAALRRANIPHRWVVMPPARQLQEMRDGATFAAGIGWIVTEERRQFARYSQALWRDGPFVAIARAGDARLQSGRGLEELLADPELTLLLKDAYSYGPEVDALIARLQPRHLRTPSPNDAMLRMIEAGRADYFLLATEEAAALLLSPALRIAELPQAPRGVVRHVMFSRKVPESLVTRFDAALRETLPPQ